MCGIAGILNGSGDGPVSLETLRRMVAMMRHRGPDGYGLYRDECVGLGHARLSIVDLAGGSQPMTNEDETLWVSFNGEIFNYRELRRELEAVGHRFRTHCDTEVILHAFEQYGEGAWRRFNGQFAFALWNRGDRTLWLVRDRLGILPLHYAIVGGRLVFASEAKALFAGGEVPVRLSGTGLMQVFTGWSAMAPSTVFEGVLSVPPGTALRFGADLRRTETAYWRPDFTEDASLAATSVDEIADALGEKLTRAVELRLRADVPVGAYLSGGLDSSVIGHLIRRVDRSPLQTFAIRFRDPTFDETAEQRRMAGLLGTQHHEILCGAEEIREALPDVIWHCETPLVRTAPVPLFHLSGLVNRTGMKVVLTGEGADEFLAGYDIFKENKVRRFWAAHPESTWRPSLLSRLYPDVGSAEQRQSAMWRRFFGQGLDRHGEPFFSHRIRWDNTSWGWRFLSPEVRADFGRDRMEQELEGSLPQGWRAWRPLSRRQMIEIAAFLSPYLLCCQGDRVAMAHSVEVRYPFLDPEVVDFCCRLPGRFRLRGLRDKVALRRLASRHLPREIWQRPKKPYRAPMTHPFFAESTPAYLDEMLSGDAMRRLGLVEVPLAEKLVEKARRQAGRMSGEREEMALIGILSLQLLGHWYGERFAGRVAEARRQLEDDRLCVLEDRCDSSRAARATATGGNTA